jgi:hypothetical protein
MHVIGNSLSDANRCFLGKILSSTPSCINHQVAMAWQKNCELITQMLLEQFDQKLGYKLETSAKWWDIVKLDLPQTGSSIVPTPNLSQGQWLELATAVTKSFPRSVDHTSIDVNALPRTFQAMLCTPKLPAVVVTSSIAADLLRRRVLASEYHDSLDSFLRTPATDVLDHLPAMVCSDGASYILKFWTDESILMLSEEMTEQGSKPLPRPLYES